jgi:hypothetical protein
MKIKLQVIEFNKLITLKVQRERFKKKNIQTAVRLLNSILFINAVLYIKNIFFD